MSYLIIGSNRDITILLGHYNTKIEVDFILPILESQHKDLNITIEESTTIAPKTKIQDYLDYNRKEKSHGKRLSSYQR